MPKDYDSVISSFYLIRRKSEIMLRNLVNCLCKNH